MDENQEWIKDYNDCINYLNNIDNYNYDFLSNWTLEKYTNWVTKDNRYILSKTDGNIPPKDNREKAINSLTNFKIALEKIAIIKGIKLN